MNWNFDVNNSVPDISNLFTAFREIYDMEAFEWLSLEELYVIMSLCILSNFGINENSRC